MGKSGLRGVGREVLQDQRAIALEPVLHPHELAALDRPDLHPAAALVVGRRDLHRWHEAAQGEALDRLHALLDLLGAGRCTALGLDGVARRLDMQSDEFVGMRHLGGRNDIGFGAAPDEGDHLAEREALALQLLDGDRRGAPE